MAYNKVVFCIFVINVMLYIEFIEAQPHSRTLQRQKRVSDQRLAELETLIALSKMKGKLVTVPVGFGRVDPSKLGRRRRSESRLLQALLNDNSSEEENVIEDEKDRTNDQNLLLNLLYEELPNKYRTVPAE